jgi:hypothetical protein
MMSKMNIDEDVKQSIYRGCEVYTRAGFQLPVANILNNNNFKYMSLAQRGLFISLVMQAWTGGKLPVNQTKLSRVLGINEDEVKQYWCTEIENFIQLIDSDDYFIMPMVEDYRNEQIKNSLLRQASGKLGGKKPRRHRAQPAKKIDTELGNNLILD